MLIVKRLTDEGVIDLNKELPFPLLPKRIAVISSATAAGYGDFCDQLNNNIYGFKFSVTLFQSAMQGAKVEEGLISALNAIATNADEWDVVIIIRGGGATSDLSCFDTYDLANNCAQFPIPIVTGIGHQRDDTLLDIVETPISPELTPADDKGNIKQKTEDLVGPYELHDFFIYHFVRYGFAPEKIYLMATTAFNGRYDNATIKKWLSTFIRRFFTQQFKRSAMPDGAQATCCTLDPQSGWNMTSDTSYAVWMQNCESIE